MKEEKLSVDELFKVLADLNRIRILKMLQERALCVCEIKEILEMATSTVSQHLSILKKFDFLIVVKKGKWVFYYINPKPKDKRIKSIRDNLNFWIGNNAIIKSDFNKLKKLDTSSKCEI